jgi:hypothetical protein
MAEVHAELVLIASAPPEERELPDVGELASRVGHLASAANAAAAARLAPRRAADALLASLNDRFLLPIHLEVLVGLEGL